jgi:hypothetical protein
MQERLSEQSKNKYGDIGSPCWVPCVSLKLSKKTPFTQTDKETDETQFMIREHQESGKPSSCMTAYR